MQPSENTCWYCGRPVNSNLPCILCGANRLEGEGRKIVNFFIRTEQPLAS